MTHADITGDAVSLYSQFLGEFLLSAASVTALSLISVFANTGMVIWAAIGAVGLITGLVTVRVARRKNKAAEAALTGTLSSTATEPTMAPSAPVYADEVTQAA